MTRTGRIVRQVFGRTGRRGASLALVVVAVALVVSACSHDKKAAPPPKLPPSTTTTTLPEFKLVVASVDVQSMRAEPVKLPDEVRAQVRATLSNYLEKAVVEPLRTGQAAVGLDAVFTPVALARLGPGTPDRAALVEDPPGVGTGAVAPDKGDISLTALADQGGEIAVVTAKLDLAVVLSTGSTQVRIDRAGEVVLMPMPGGWRIDSYDLVTKRDTVPPPAPTTTTTARKGA
jgi:hypothetical protein